MPVVRESDRIAGVWIVEPTIHGDQPASTAKGETIHVAGTLTHAEVSCWNPFDSYGEEYDRAADKYFRNSRRPTIAETIAYFANPASSTVTNNVIRVCGQSLLGA